jgi:hypothetical protein
MARQPVHPAIVSDEVDQFIGRLFFVTVVLLCSMLVFVNVGRWMGLWR